MHADIVAQLSPSALQRLGGMDLEYDADKLHQLAEVVPDEQDAVLRAHLSLHVPWADALLGKTLRSSSPANPQAHEPNPGRRVESRKLAELKPNRFNAVLFPDSLSAVSVELLADDLARNGQRVPGEVTPDGTIVDCERRWRAAKLLGWDEMAVTLVEGLTDDILDRVLDSCTSVRHLTVREQVNVYSALHERLKREAGRRQGRPEKTFQKGDLYLTPRSIRDAAAKRAGFSSVALAARAEAVFGRGSEEIQNRVRDGTLSISAAYDLLPKRGRRTEPEPAAQERDEEPGETEQPQVDTSPLLADAEGPPVTDTTDEALESADEDAEGPSDPDSDAPEPPVIEANNIWESDSMEVMEEDRAISDHVSAVCRHLSRLAEADYDDAVAWFDQVVEELKAALGEPPQQEYEEAFDE